MNFSGAFSVGRFTMLPLDVGVVLGALCQPVCEAFPVVLRGVRRTISTRPLSFCPKPSMDSHTISDSFFKITFFDPPLEPELHELQPKNNSNDLTQTLNSRSSLPPLALSVERKRETLNLSQIISAVLKRTSCISGWNMTGKTICWKEPKSLLYSAMI